MADDSCGYARRGGPERQARHELTSCSFSSHLAGAGRRLAARAPPLSYHHLPQDVTVPQAWTSCLSARVATCASSWPALLGVAREHVVFHERTHGRCARPLLPGAWQRSPTIAGYLAH